MNDTASQALLARLQPLLSAEDAILIAHYYVPAEIQKLAEATGGFVGDSLAMAEFGFKAEASTLLVSGVRFMGESAKILSPQKRVLMPTLKATCSLDLGCSSEDFAQFRAQHPDRTVVVYANTSANVKAQADWVVTSSNALAIIEYLDVNGEKILWAPDRYLGNYLQKKTGADMILWQGSCIVHEEFNTQALLQLKQQYPDAAILVHPESPMGVVDLADVVGSTTHLLKASQTLPHSTFIVATDNGLFYKMKQASPHKNFLSAPTAGINGSCQSCGYCPWMQMNNLELLEQALLSGNNEIILENDIIAKAKNALMRMLNFNSHAK